MLGLGLRIWFVVDGWGRGYEGANRSIIAELPALADVELVEQDHDGYCRGDSCPLGNDRSGALAMYAVDTDRYTQDSPVLNAAFASATSLRRTSSLGSVLAAIALGVGRVRRGHEGREGLGRCPLTAMLVYKRGHSSGDGSSSQGWRSADRPWRR